MKRTGIFISYRRDTGRDIARNVYDRLTMDGYATFFDYDSMRAGKFNEQIFDAIDNSLDFILILTDGTLDRCINDGDWVREELEYAISHKKNIILFGNDNYIFPPLPESLASLPLYEIIPLNHSFYNESYARLVQNLSSRRNKKRMYAGIIFSLVVIVALLISALVKHNSTGKSTIISDISAEMYLKNYREFDHEFDDAALESFMYEDSLDLAENYYIFPVYETPIKKYHMPILKIRLISKQKKTVILNQCYLEVADYQSDDSPSGVVEEINNMALINIPVVHIGLSNGSYSIPQFDRNLKQGETDDDFIFALYSTLSCHIKARLKLLSSNGETIYSPWVQIKICIPDGGMMYPIYQDLPS